ncbi:DNA metabolism protein [Pontibacter qinzhouensis]|uniref:DNA metabolism protein n=1 Tax=Pontibacter qinzhouensis TaxID=2603253 RepID=A0A5C8K9G1_9BACT|nr:TIGR03915 family putative DNA repair protein [Pontibacter qinzhouensis]TXK49015.1 DNA metabolism protein [Pontibacter qinzhouensis]
MVLYTYDGSFEGLLTVVFEAYERKAWPDKIEPEHQAQPLLLGQTVAVTTDDAKANRVWQGLQQRLSAGALRSLYHTYLWEQPGFEMLLFHYVRLAFSSPENIEGNFTADCVLQVQQASKQVHREKHRMEAFVRFQKTQDGLYYAAISPDYNVLPLIIDHFQKRYADQRWVLYDLNRRYGTYYDLQTVTLVSLEKTDLPVKQQGVLQKSAFDAEEAKYQELWQVYFDHVNIPERKNPKLHLRHVPKRYWKYLSEKQPRQFKT